MAKALDFGFQHPYSLEIPGSNPGVVDYLLEQFFCHLRERDVLFVCQLFRVTRLLNYQPPIAASEIAAYLFGIFISDG
jgi:hypothetical protein